MGLGESILWFGALVGLLCTVAEMLAALVRANRADAWGDDDDA